jgi:hypothetical protein
MPCCARRPVSIVVLVIAVGVAAYVWWYRYEEAFNPRPPAPSGEPDYSQVADGLYIGARVDKPPPGTRAVLNLCELEDPYRCEFETWPKSKIPDSGPAPSKKWLREQVEFVDTQRRAGVPVYIHCMAGVSRAAMVTTAYLMFKYGWDRDEAIEFLKTKRPQVNPNPAFMELLLLWDAELLHGMERLKVMPREVSLAEPEGIRKRQLELLKALDNLKQFAPDDSDLENWKWGQLQNRVIGPEVLEVMPREVK